MLKMKFLIFLLLGSYVFAQNGESDYDESESDTPETQNGSFQSDLAFVVDKSSNLVLNLKNHIPNLLNKWSNNENNFHNYILVRFDNSEIKKETFNNIDTLKTGFTHLATSNIRSVAKPKKPVCSGKSLGAIENALESILPKSLIIVFTDGESSDTRLLPKILPKLESHQIQVLFVFPKHKDCKPQSEEYGKIAYVSNGQIFEVPENNFTNIIDYLAASIKFPRVDLLAIDAQKRNKNNKIEEFYIPTDESLTEIFITISAPKNINLTVTDSADDSQNPLSLLSKGWRETNAQMYNIQEHGNKTLKLVVTGNSSYSLRVSAASNEYFTYGFQPFSQPNSDQKIYSLPIEGKNNSFIVSLDTSRQIDSLDTVNITLADDKLIKSFSLNPVPSSTNKIYSGSFDPSNISEFRLKIIGKTNGLPFQRITPILNATPETQNVPAKGIPYISQTTSMDSDIESQTPSKTTNSDGHHTSEYATSATSDNQKSSENVVTPAESSDTTNGAHTNATVETTTLPPSSASTHSSHLATILTVFFIVVTVYL